MEDNKPSIAVNAVLSFIKTVSSILFPLITFMYASRVLGVDGVGQVTFSRGIVSYFTTIAIFGVNYYGTREVAKRRDNRYSLRKFCHEMLFINGVSCIISYILLYLSLLYIPKFGDYELLILVNSATIFLTYIGMDWLYHGLEKFRFITIRTVVFQFVALLYMLTFVKTKDDVLTYTITLIISSSGAFIFNFFHARNLITFQKSDKNYDIKMHLKPMLWLFAFALSIELYTVMDSTMLGFLKGDTAVGLYTVAVKTNKMADTLVTSLGVVLIPRLAYYLSHKEESESKELIKKAYNFIFLFSIPLCFVVFVLSQEIIILFSGSAFLPATFTMRLLTPIIIIIPFNVLTNIQIFIPMGKEHLVLLSSIFAVLVNFVTNWFLIPVFSQDGAAIGTVIAEGSCAILCYIFAKKYIGINEIFKVNYHYWIASLPILGIGYFASCYFSLYLVRIIFTCGISAVVYFLFLYAFKNPYFYYMLNFFKKRFLI